MTVSPSSISIFVYNLKTSNVAKEHSTDSFPKTFVRLIGCRVPNIST